MLDIGWSELAVVAVLALLVIGPKDLPGVMRTVGRWMQKARNVSREFQSSVDDMVREAELEDARKALDSAKSMNVQSAIENTIDPTGEVKESALELDREARREDPDETTPAEASPKSEPGDGEPEAGQAKIVKQPLNIAPPHSVTPPPPKDQAAAPSAAAPSATTPSAAAASAPSVAEKSASGSSGS